MFTKLKNLTKKQLRVIIGLATAFLIFVLALPPIIVRAGRFQIYTEIDNVEETKIGIVFGAGVTDNNQPSDMLRDRLLTAKELYKEDKIQKIVVSGDNRVSHYNEPQVMYDYLVSEGIPKNSLVRDYAGRRTYDTCFRAKEIFEIEEALLISQGYHLPRAIFLCEKFGIEASGYSATRRPYIGERYFKTREILALYKSILDIYILKPTSVLGKKEPID